MSDAHGISRKLASSDTGLVRLAEVIVGDTACSRMAMPAGLNGVVLICLVRLAGIEPTTLGFGGSLDDYEKYLILP